MKLTDVLFKQRVARMWKGIWKTRGRFVTPELRVAKVFEEKNIEIIDPTKPAELERWSPPVKDQRFYTRPPEEEEPNYNEDLACMVTPKTRLLQGIEQACVLAKAKLTMGFPETVEKLVGAVEIPDQDMLVQRYIMQSQVWDPTMDKLPKRIDKRKIGWHFQRQYGIKKDKSSEILLRNMIRLCQSVAERYPSIATERRLIYKPYLGTNYLFKDNLITFQGLYEYLVSGRIGLQPFADEELVDATATHAIPDMYPISPLIDLNPKHCYSLETLPGFRKAHSHCVPQTLFMLNKNYWNADQRQARCLLFCLAATLAEARRLHGTHVGVLPQPISVQCINMDQTQINFVFFQLNTLDFLSSDGVKNMAWFSNRNDLFVKKLSQPWLGKEFRKTTYVDYDPTVFQRFLAVMMNGLMEVQAELKGNTPETVQAQEL